VLTLEQANEEGTVRIATAGQSLDGLLSKQWLLTNARGSYAASTIAGCNTSSYHGLLVGSLDPPAHRLMALANCLEMVICAGRVFQLSTFEFGDKFAPTGHTYLREFQRDTGARFVYQTDAALVEKAVYLARDHDTVAIEYTFSHLAEPIEFVVRPFVGLRDFHLLQRSYAPLTFDSVPGGLSVRHDVPGSCELLLWCPEMRFEKDTQWWFNFRYRINDRRGQDGTEDLWTPGFFKGRVERPGRLLFRAHLCQRYRPQDGPLPDIDEIKSQLQQHQQSLFARARAQSSTGKLLCLAADQFIAQRRAGGVERCTVLAGFPWFADWGRDAFIALPGLLLATGRHEQARSVLRNFAGAVDRGMIPNRFDDRSPTAYFNSVDASLWFVHAAFVYLEATEDLDGFTRELLPAVQWIIDAYEEGTRFAIRADTDGLITAGDEQTQLTWMDAKYGGVAFTPRWGKAVEVNALWHNALVCMQRFYEERDASHAARYREMHEKVGTSFVSLFWNDDCGYLNDTVRSDGSADAHLRPNQIFAVSLPGPTRSSPCRCRTVRRSRGPSSGRLSRRSRGNCSLRTGCARSAPNTRPTWAGTRVLCPNETGHTIKARPGPSCWGRLWRPI
jgi:predicted glycogen debranching enzyme